MSTHNLLQSGGDAGPISCLACGAVLASGALPHPCPVRFARNILGASPVDHAEGFFDIAMTYHGGPDVVRALADDFEATAVALRARLDAVVERPLRVYVAGGASERAQAGVWIRRLREAGVEVTHDWTGDAAWYGGTVAKRAAADLDGVRRADVLWYLAPADKSEGSSGELCAALVLGKRVIVSGPWDAAGRIFPGLAGERYAGHEEGFAGVVRAAAGRVSDG